MRDAVLTNKEVSKKGVEKSDKVEVATDVDGKREAKEEKGRGAHFLPPRFSYLSLKGCNSPREAVAENLWTPFQAQPTFPRDRLSSTGPMKILVPNAWGCDLHAS